MEAKADLVFLYRFEECMECFRFFFILAIVFFDEGSEKATVPENREREETTSYVYGIKYTGFYSTILLPGVESSQAGSSPAN
jgi:hypothetical protein